jgi:hypothetical protein
MQHVELAPRGVFHSGELPDKLAHPQAFGGAVAEGPDHGEIYAAPGSTSSV